MRLRIITVGAKQPSWVDAAVTDYLRRFKSPWRVELLEIEAATRSATRSAEVAVQREGESVLAALRDRERVILLDETGKSLSTRELASKLEALAREAPDLALLIGGPDGHAAAVRERAAASWSLSRLTLPHGLARVLLVEQLYRAHTLASGHPYHRD
ncbi:MAG: 23S rRNA (pseudouridine(1915)-N(3))-methyltransferase RlmH [Gammaproteobacteria bacterium]|nr:23S rRNA (pseudouridine(1915)-N(3))-methyltransferase RlmH [Gammaproteobacteria bacterium]